MYIRGSSVLIIELQPKHKLKIMNQLSAKDMEELGKIAAKILIWVWTEDSIISLGTLGSYVEIH
jgi:hypothetical protein